MDAERFETALPLGMIKDSHSEEIEEYRRDVKSIENIRIPCDFVENVCYAYRQRSHVDAQWLTDVPCCCNGCGRNLGYLWVARKKIKIYRDDIPLYANAFDYKTGFWRKNIGCLLPRHLRSPTCNFHVCIEIGNNKQKVSDDDLKTLIALRRKWTDMLTKYERE